MKLVVAMAIMVPVGIDFCASLRSPERFEPAMIPTITHKIKLGLINSVKQLHTKLPSKTVQTGAHAQASSFTDSSGDLFFLKRSSSSSFYGHFHV